MFTERQKINEVTCEFRAASPYLEELKDRLASLIQKEAEGHVSYRGGAEADALYKAPDCGIMMLTMKKGELFGDHLHKVKEWIIVISGSFETHINGETFVVGPKEEIVFEPGATHGGKALEDLKCICITIPADEDYTDVRDND